MKPGAVATIVLTVVGLSAVVFSFIRNASPYVTVAQAGEMRGNNLHLAGDIDRSTLTVASFNNTVTFKIVDEEGAEVTVVYHGPPPANMGEATKVVAVGSMVGDHFEAHKLLLKCPSKYESEADPGS
ncbi:MAG: cytochrome c maturation protein CcmE [Planctomycetes bacterium]|nr:cytochrome c maturation protein CcmE [Planctomycetota bacterium]